MHCNGHIATMPYGTLAEHLPCVFGVFGINASTAESHSITSCCLCGYVFNIPSIVPKRRKRSATLHTHFVAVAAMFAVIHARVYASAYKPGNCGHSSLADAVSLAVCR